MITTRQAVPILRRFAEYTETYAAYESYVYYFTVTEARGAEIHVDTCGECKVFSRPLIGQEGHHEVLEQTTRFGEGHVDSLCSVGSLLEEYSIAAKFADVDGDVEALTGEYAVHYWDVLVGGSSGAAYGDDQDAGLEA